MKIKNLMDFLNKDSAESVNGEDVSVSRANYDAWDQEKVIYINDDDRLDTASEQSERKEILRGGTQWADQTLGELLVNQGKLDGADVERVIMHQRDKGMYFGEAAIDLKLISQDDVLQALSSQFGYTYGQDDEPASKEMVMASSPFGEQAEEFRSIRGRLLNDWLSVDQKTLAVVSPGNKEGRSYVAANLALAFSQLDRLTLLIDADLRSPRQHEIFSSTSRIGLSMLLAGRVRIEQLDMLPNRVSAFQYLSVLGCGAVPPNPSELLSNGRFPIILRELKKYFDVIIVDTPSGVYKSDVISIASMAGSALLVARGGHSRINETKSLMSILSQAKAQIVGAVLNQY